MKLKDGIVPTKRSDLVPRNTLRVTLLKVVGTISFVAAFIFATYQFLDKPLVIFLFASVALILVLAFWIPRVKQRDRGDSDQWMD